MEIGKYWPRTRSQKDLEFQETGEIIRVHELGEVSTTPGRNTTGGDDRSDHISGTTSRKRTRNGPTDSDGEESGWVRLYIAKRSEFRQTGSSWKRNESNRRRGEESGKRMLRIEEKQAECTEKILDMEERRPSIDEKRLYLNSEERKGKMKEREKPIGVLGAILNKVGEPFWYRWR